MREINLRSLDAKCSLNKQDEMLMFLKQTKWKKPKNSKHFVKVSKISSNMIKNQRIINKMMILLQSQISCFQSVKNVTNWRVWLGRVFPMFLFFSEKKAITFFFYYRINSKLWMYFSFLRICQASSTIKRSSDSKSIFSSFPQTFKDRY